MGGGEYYACRACTSHGDMIQFAAASWKLSLTATLRRIDQCGVPLPAEVLGDSAIARYVEALGRRERIEQLWKTAQQNMRGGETHASGRLRQRLGLTLSLPRDRWDQGPGRLHGIVDRADVEEAFEPFLKKNGDRPGRKGQVFFGSGWKEIVLIPFWDMPQHLSGFYLIGRENRSEDHVFQVASDYRSTKLDDVDHREAGLAFVDIVRDDLCLPGPVVGVGDPRLALRMHFRQARAGKKFLPIVAWHDDGYIRTISAWQQLAGLDLVIWSPGELTPSAVRQAAALNAKLRTVPYDVDHNLTAQMQYERIALRARPWPLVLVEMLDTLPDLKAFEFLAETQLSFAQFEQVLKANSTACELRTYRERTKGTAAERRERLKGLYEHKQMRRSIAFSGRELVEHGGQWHIRMGGGRARYDLFFDGMVRIDQIFRSKSGRQEYCKGRVLYRDQEFAFCELRAELERNPVEWLTKLVSPQLGKPLLGAGLQPRWSKHILDIALRFHEPTFHECEETIGWHEPSRSLVLPSFLVMSGGRVCHQTAAPIALPAKNIVQDSEMGIERVLALLESKTSHHILWGVVASVLANVLAIPNERKPVGTCLAGDGIFRFCRVAAQACGCLVEEPVAKSSPHTWPAIVEPVKNLSEAERRLLVDRRNLLFPTEASMACTFALQDGWRVVKGDDICWNGGQLPLSVLTRCVLPGYLQYVASGDFRIAQGDPTRPWVLVVLHDLADWLVSKVGDRAEIITEAASVILPEESHCLDTLSYLLKTLLKEGRLVYGRKGWNEVGRDRMGATLLAQGGEISPSHVILDLAGLQRVLRAPGGLPWLTDETIQWLAAKMAEMGLWERLPAGKEHGLAPVQMELERWEELIDWTEGWAGRPA